jgi:hypothetical protein
VSAQLIFADQFYPALTHLLGVVHVRYERLHLMFQPKPSYAILNGGRVSLSRNPTVCPSVRSRGYSFSLSTSADGLTH